MVDSPRSHAPNYESAWEQIDDEARALKRYWARGIPMAFRATECPYGQTHHWPACPQERFIAAERAQAITKERHPYRTIRPEVKTA